MTESIASQIKFNPDAGAEAAATESYEQGWVRSVVSSAVIKPAKDKPGKLSPNWYGLNVKVKPMADIEDPDSGQGEGILVWIGLPFEPAAWATRDYDDATLTKLRTTLRKFTQMGTRVMSSLFPEDVPAMPRKIDGVYYYKGEEMEEDGYDRCKRETYEAVVAKMEELVAAADEGTLEDESTGLIGNAIYHKIEFEEGSDYPRAKFFDAEHPTWDGQLVELLTGDITSLNIPEAPANGRAGKVKTKAPARKKKAAKKKAKGRGARR